MKRNGRTSSSWVRWSQEVKTALCMFVLLLTMQTVAAFQYEGITYTINSDGESVTATTFDAKAVTPPTLIIPDYAWSDGKAYPVTVIADNAFSRTKTFTKIVIGDNVKTIGRKAFEHFAEDKLVVTLVLGKGVTDCDAQAFEHFGEKAKGCKLILKGTDPAVIQTSSFQHMKNAMLYVQDEETYKRFMANADWKNYDLSTSKVGNQYTYPFPADVSLKGGMWQTAVFPIALSKMQLESLFGQGTKVARLSKNEYKWDGQDEYVVRFNLQETVDAREPVLIKPTNGESHYVSEVEYGVERYEDNPKVMMTDTDHGWTVRMIGICHDNYNLDFGQIYMRNQNGTMYFFMADNENNNPEEKSNVWVKRGKCIFEMCDTETGEPLTDVSINYDIQSSITAIHDVSNTERIAREGVYSLTGRYEGTSTCGLAKGIYIVNGRKVVLK